MLMPHHTGCPPTSEVICTAEGRFSCCSFASDGFLFASPRALLDPCWEVEIVIAQTSNVSGAWKGERGCRWAERWQGSHWITWALNGMGRTSQTPKWNGEEPRMGLQMWAVPWEPKRACKTPRRDKRWGCPWKSQWGTKIGKTNLCFKTWGEWLSRQGVSSNWKRRR